jgi:hypothetical protein
MALMRRRRRERKLARMLVSLDTTACEQRRWRRRRVHRVAVGRA